MNGQETLLSGTNTTGPNQRSPADKKMSLVVTPPRTATGYESSRVAIAPRARSRIAQQRVPHTLFGLAGCVGRLRIGRKTDGRHVRPADMVVPMRVPRETSATYDVTFSRGSSPPARSRSVVPPANRRPTSVYR